MTEMRKLTVALPMIQCLKSPLLKTVMVTGQVMMSTILVMIFVDTVTMMTDRQLMMVMLLNVLLV